MTYIEFFDRTAVENIAACLTFRPEKVIFVGSNLNTMYTHKAIYEEIAREHGLQTEFLNPKVVSKSNLKAGLRILQEIVDENEECVFDLTGGEEILCLALGMICAQNPEKNIRLHKFHLSNSQVVDCDPEGNEMFYAMPDMTVRDQIRICGGDIVYGNVESADTYPWKPLPRLQSLVSMLWELCNDDVSAWNAQMTVLAMLEEIGKREPGGLTTTANVNVLSSKLSRNNNVFVMDEKLLGTLHEWGLLGWSVDADTVSVTYRDLEVRRIISKAGTILEMKVFMAAMGLRDENGDPVYQDGQVGVMIDWDGEHHADGVSYDRYGKPVLDIENEIDVMLMHGAIPVFISCKNGGTDDQELYKFNTVADRFGEKYAKKALVVNGLPQRSSKAEYLRQRARDMGITLIERVQDMTEQQLQAELDNLWR